MSTFRDYLELHFLVVLWGFTAILGKLITIPAVELVLHRTILAAVALAVLLWFKKESFKLGSKVIWGLLGNGALVGLHWITFFAAARIANVSVSLAGFATIALWTSILEPLILKRRIKWFEVVLGLVIILGLYVIFRFEFEHAWGLVVAIVSAFLVSLFTVFNVFYTHKFNHYTITFYEMVGAVLSILVLLPVYNHYQGGLDLLPTTMDWVYIAILALVCTVYAYSMGVELMKRISAFALNLTVNLEPIYGIILALIIFGDSEKMTPQFYLGGLIVVVAVLCYPLLNRYFSSRISNS